MDSDCFSATDVLLNSLKGRKNIVLIGTPSGGGSGRSYIYFFPGEPINILRLSTMISYKTNGELIEGNGIDTDIYLEESITDFMGQTDSMLDQAINVLKNK
jgi:C-terminal processing protease CtpA/Prc